MKKTAVKTPLYSFIYFFIIVIITPVIFDSCDTFEEDHVTEASLGTGVEFQKPINRTQSPLSKFDSPGLYTFYNLFYRVEYPENGRFRVLAQPTFNYAFGINKNLNAPFYVKPYGFGLNFGVTYKF